MKKKKFYSDKKRVILPEFEAFLIEEKIFFQVKSTYNSIPPRSQYLENHLLFFLIPAQTEKMF